MKLFLKTSVIAGIIALFTACGSTFELFPDPDSDTPANTAPVANAGSAQTVAVNTLVTLNGSGSSDANGDSLTYSWSFTSKPSGSMATLSSATAVNPTFTADVAGSYVVSLVVSDGKAASSASTVTITATATTANVAPVANAGSPQTVLSGDIVVLDGRGSSDADGDALTYEWTLTPPSGSTATLSNTTAVNPTFTADVVGTYNLSLTVKDGKTASLASFVTVTVVLPVPVKADAGLDQYVALNKLVTLDGSGSTDKRGVTGANGGKLNYVWNFISKPVGSGVLTGSTTVNPTFTATVSGIYKISLQVNDPTDPNSTGSTDEVIVNCNLGSITVTW